MALERNALNLVFYCLQEINIEMQRKHARRGQVDFVYMVSNLLSVSVLSPNKIIFVFVDFDLS